VACRRGAGGKYGIQGVNVATNRQKKAVAVVLVAAGGAAAAAYSQIGLPRGVLAVLSSEPTVILLSGSLLVGLGGALRRFDF
jgi:hypothetical protein